MKYSNFPAGQLYNLWAGPKKNVGPKMLGPIYPNLNLNTLYSTLFTLIQEIFSNKWHFSYAWKWESWNNKANLRKAELSKGANNGMLTLFRIPQLNDFQIQALDFNFLFPII